MKRTNKKQCRHEQSDKPDVGGRIREKILGTHLGTWQRRLRIHPSALNDPQLEPELIRRLGSDRLARFRSLVVAYQQNQNLENYIQLRRNVPEAEIDIAWLFGGIDSLFNLEPELRKHDIDPLLVAGALDAIVPDMDELSLRLMECLVAKEKLPKGGPGHIEKRRNAISDALVDYLIVMMLEATEWNEESAPNELPSSLIVLIRERLCGAEPDLLTKYRSSEERVRAAYLVASHFKDLKGISARKLAAITGMSKTTTGRWLKDPSFKEYVEWIKTQKESKKPK